MARSSGSRPARTLGWLIGTLLVLYAAVSAGVVWSNAQWAPKLGLDLEGGTEIVLTPVPTSGETTKIPENTITRSIDIIRQRINGNGVSEADVTTQGSNNIVVSLPGKPDPETIKLVKQSAQLRFRAVLGLGQVAPAPGATPTAPPTGTPPSGAPATGTAPTTPGATGAGAPGAAASSTAPTATSKPAPSASSNGRAIPQALLAETPSTGPSTGAGSDPAAAAKTASTPAPAPSGSVLAPSGSGAKPSPTPTGASDLKWATEPVAAGSPKTYQDEYDALDCTKEQNLKGGKTPDVKKPLATCAKDGTTKYLLGPAEVVGTDLATASAGPEVNAQGAVTGTGWQVNLTFNGAGAKKFADVTTRLAALQGAQNQFAIVLDGLVVSAPGTNEAILGGQAQITGNFSEVEAQTLANQLKYGALPVSFQEQTEHQISATLGGEQLRRGLLAGLIGLLLVVAYSLAQYRALGFITVFSLGVAATVTYGLVLLLGWRQGYRLSLAGVAGLIVSIGITADSFIVFFERVRDEVRDGRGLVAAVEAAWVRARRTILASDFVSFLAAVVLYVLAIGSVRGFAFTLGLTTLVDILVVFMFTKPAVSLLARTKFFGGGHRLSGFDPEHLGRTVVYAGRGRVRGGPTIAERRAAAQRSLVREEGDGTAPDGKPGKPPDRPLERAEEAQGAIVGGGSSAGSGLATGSGAASGGAGASGRSGNRSGKES